MIKKVHSIILSIVILFTFIFIHSNVQAANEEKTTSDEELLKLYDKLDYILHVNDGWLIQDVIRSFLWGIVTTLKWLNTFIENSVNKIITFNDFYSSPAMENLMGVIKPLVFGLFLVSLFVLGFQFMLNKIEKRHEILLNILMAVSIVVVIPILMSSMDDLLGVGMKQMKGEKGTLAGEIIKSNVADLSYYIDKNFVMDGSSDNKYYGSSSTPPTPLDKDYPSIGTTDFTNANQLSTKNPNIAVTEKLDIQADQGLFPWTTEEWVTNLKENNKTAYDFLLHTRVPSGNGEEYKIKKLAKNKIPSTDLGQQAYYRYHVNWGVLIFSLLVTSIALVITVIKIGRAIFDLAFHQIFGMFVAVTDLTGGQRTKKILIEIANTFGVLFIMVFILKLFMMFSNWTNGLKAEIGAIPVLLLLIAGAWAVIDAPDIVQRLMGIDAGLRSGYQALMGAYAGVGLAKNAAQGTKHLATGTVAKGLGAANFTRRMVSGITSKTPAEITKSGMSTSIVNQIPNSMPLQNNQSGDRQMDKEIPLADTIQGNNAVKTSENKRSETPSLDKRGQPISNQKGIEGAVFHSTNTGQSNQRPLGKRDSSSTGEQNNVATPSRYSQTKSGIYVPHSKAEQNEPLHSVDNSGSLTVRDNQTAHIPEHHEATNFTSATNESEKISTPSQLAAPVITKQGYGGNLQHGHKKAQHTNTLIGGNDQIRQIKEYITRAGNSGFTLGQNIRRVGLGAGKAASALRNKKEVKSFSKEVKEIDSRKERIDD